MVLPGQFLERPTVIPVGDEVLEGLSHRGERPPPLLILPPRPDEGGSMDHVVAAEVVWAAACAGHPTLRFNYRGVGASQGTRGSGASLVVEAEAALRLLQENTGVAGVAVLALGGAGAVGMALRNRHPAVLGLCFVSPAELLPEELFRLRVRPFVVVGELDRRVPRAALAAAVSEAGGALEVIAGADAAFNKNLPLVGKAVTSWLQALPGEEV